MASALPVLFSCKGCVDYGNMACDVASVLARRGLAESAWLGNAAAGEAELAAKARSRAPVYVIDGCAKRCAYRWIASQAVKVKRLFILAAPGDTAEQIAERIAAGW